MNALLLFCAYMAFVRVPRDLLTTPPGSEEEVWFGILFRGGAAQLLALLHELVYAAGAYAFWRMSAWMWPWAALYAGQVALSAAVWPLLYRSSARGLAAGAGLAFVPPPPWRPRGRLARGHR